MCKLFSMLLNNRLSKVLESQESICDEQNGFRKARACVDHLFVLTTIIKQRKVHNLPTIACILDFEEAFGKTDKSMLSRRLKSNFLFISVSDLRVCTC